MDKSSANKVAIDEINANREAPMVVRQVKYLNNIEEQDHRAVKRKWYVSSTEICGFSVDATEPKDVVILAQQVSIAFVAAVIFAMLLFAFASGYQSLRF